MRRCRTSEFYYISMYFAFTERTASPLLSSIHPSLLLLLLSLSLFLSSLLCLHSHGRPKRNNTVSSPALTMMHEPDGKHFSGVVIIKPFFFSLHRPHVKEIQRQGPKCNTLISLKLFIGICGAPTAGLSPFQLPDLFNSVGNEKCAAQLELWSKKKTPSVHSLFSTLFYSLSLSFQSALTHVGHVSLSVFAAEWLKMNPNF